MNTGMGLDVTVYPAPGEVIQDPVPPQAGVEGQEEAEECEPTDFSGDDERKPPELPLPAIP